MALQKRSLDQDNSDSDIRQYFKRSKEVYSFDIGKSYMENERVSVYSISY